MPNLIDMRLSDEQLAAIGFSTAPRSRLALGIATAVALLLTACSTTQSAMDAITAPFDTEPPETTMSNETPATLGWRQARIVAPVAPLQCVPYARRVSGIAMRGDAWTWWRAAEGRYRKGSKPAVGSVLAFERTWRLRLGHVAVVTRILGDREIVVEHANWLNRGNIHKSTPVRDVSRANDWSAVRVWYTPGNRYGARTYPAHGFIHPERRISVLSLSGATTATPSPGSLQTPQTVTFPSSRRHGQPRQMCSFAFIRAVPLSTDAAVNAYGPDEKPPAVRQRGFGPKHFSTNECRPLPLSSLLPALSARA